MMSLSGVMSRRRMEPGKDNRKLERCLNMGRTSKFTDEQKMEIALELLSGKVSHAEVCRKWDISSTYAYKLKDRALELLRSGIGKPAGRPSGEVDQLRKRVGDLEQLAGDQALAIRYLKKNERLK